MKNLNLTRVLVLILISLNFGCDDKPVANFVANEANPIVGEHVFFTDMSTNDPDAWNWSISPVEFDYLDGTSSFSQHPVVQFNKAGSYSVDLTVSNKSGSDNSRKDDYIKVVDPEPEINITWTEKAEMPVALSWTQACVLDDKIYIAGGMTGDLITKILLIYDPINDTWDSSKASMNHRRFGHSIDAVNGKIYVMGGASEPGPCLLSIEVYDPVSDKWEEFGNMTNGKAGHGSCVLNDKIYVAGGNLIEPSEDVLNDFEFYDPEENAWVNLAPLPTINTYMSLCTYKNKIYAIGGTIDFPWDGLPNIEEFDPNTNSWISNSELNIGRWGLAVVEVNDMIICSGGTIASGFKGISSSEAYLPGQNLVMKASSISIGRQGMAACSYNDKIYIFGGCISGAPDWGNNTSSTLEGVIVN